MPLVLTRCSGQYSSQNLPAVPPVFSSLLPTRCCHSMCLNPYPLFPPVCPVTPAGWSRRNTCWVAPRTAQWWRRVWPVRLQAARKCLRCRPVASPPGKAHWPEWGSASCREPALSFPTSHCPLAGICKGCWLHNTNMNRRDQSYTRDICSRRIIHTSWSEILSCRLCYTGQDCNPCKQKRNTAKCQDGSFTRRTSQFKLGL